MSVFHVASGLKKYAAWLVLRNPKALLACISPHGETLEERQCITVILKRVWIPVYSSR